MDATPFPVSPGELILVEVDVAGDKQIEPAIAVIVAESGSAGPVAELDAGFFGHVGEGAVVVVVVEAVLAVVGDEEVGVTVVVVVADGYAKAPAVVGDSCLGGDVGEGAVVVVVEEGGVGRLRFAGKSVVGGAVDHVDVEPAVFVVVQEGYA